MENFQLKKIVFDWKGKKKYERKENVVIDRVIFLGSSQAFPPLSEKEEQLIVRYSIVM